MTLHDLVKTTEKLTVDNSPAILTAIGVVGTITTAVLSGRAALESQLIIDYTENEFSRILDRKERAQIIWKVWILPVSVGTLTVSSIIFANRIGSRRAAAMATAYVISEKAFEEYREKVVERIGKNKEQVVRDDIAQDRVNKTPNTTVFVGEDKQLCFDMWSGRYFESTMETIKKAMNDTNYKILGSDYASLNEFWDKIGLPPTPPGEEVGWRSDEPMDIYFSSIISENGKPCIAVNFTVVPSRDYYKLF